MKAADKSHRRVLITWLSLIVCATGLLVLVDVALGSYARRAKHDSPVAQLKAGIKHFREDDCEHAMEAARRALELDPDMADAFVLQGAVYAKQGDHADAAEAYLRAIDLGSRDPRHRVNAMWCLIESDQTEKAIRLAERSFREGYDDQPDLHRTMAVALVRAGRLTDAIPHLEAALEAYPTDTYILTNLVRAHSEQGNTDRVAELTQRVEGQQLESADDVIVPD